MIIRLHKNMKPRLLSLVDKILLRNKTLVAMVNDQLTNICQIEHFKHPGPINAFVPLLDQRPALGWRSGLHSLGQRKIEKLSIKSILSKNCY